MVSIIVTNTQMGAFIEKNGTLGSCHSQSLRLSTGFLISKGPVLNFGLKAKKVRQNHGVSRNCGQISVLLKGEPSNGGIMEREFEFKPSFDEYLKAMESVKSVRQKRKQAAHPSTMDKPRNGEENGKLGDFEEEISGKKSKLLVKDKEGGKLKGARRMGFEENGSAGITHRLVRNGLDFKQSGVDVKVRRKKLGMETENGRWTNNRVGSVHEVQSYDTFDGDRFRDDKGHKIQRRDHFQGEKIYDKSALQNANRGRGSIREVQSYDKFEGEFRDEKGHQLRKRYHFQGEKIYDKSALQNANRGRGSIQEVQSYDKFEGDRFRDDKGHQIRKRDHFQVEKIYDKRALQNVNRGRGDKLRIGDNSDDEIEADRAAFKSIEKYNDVYDQPRVSRMDMEERIQTLAKCLNGADIDMPEWMFSKMMRSAKIRFADHSMLRVIQILGKLGNWRRVLQVIEWIQSRERFKSHKIRFIYTAALDALGKARRPVEALNVFYAMQQQMSSYPDLVAYHCIAVTLGQAGHMKELFDVIDSMQSPPKKKFKTRIIEKWDPRLKPDIVVYNAVLNACVHRKKWEGAFWVLQQLKEEGQQPTSTTYGLVMEVMFACGKYSLVHDFFKKVQKSSIPNALTYKVLVNTHWREGNVDKAVSAVQDMERRGIIGTSGLYYDLARSLCSAGRCQEALMQIDKICKVANKPLVVTYTGLIQACLDSGNIQNAVYIFNQMHKFCSPNLVTCNIMLRAYLEHEMFEEAKGLFEKLVDSGHHISSKLDYKNRVIPDIYTFNLMLDACTIRQRWDDLEFIYKRMLQHGFHFNAKRHLRMILDACRAGKMELLETTWKHLVQADQLPPPLLTKHMFCKKLEEDDYAAAISCLANHPSDESQEFFQKSWLNFFRENSHRLRRETIVGLVHEISSLTARSDSPNLVVLKNLNTSCKEFLRTQITVADLDQTVSRPQSAALMF